jgi:uncharacterized protein YdeI (BOF family)
LTDPTRRDIIQIRSCVKQNNHFSIKKERMYMKRAIIILVVFMAAGIVLAAESKERKSVSTARPSVVKTIPQCGDAQVDPNTRNISVTFSKEMMDASWSWSTADEGQFPDIVGKPKYLADKKMCVIEVKLKPQTTYAIWLNSEKFHGFKDKDGRSAVPYLLVFETK